MTGAFISEEVALSATGLRFVAMERGLAPQPQTFQPTTAAENEVAFPAVFSPDSRRPPMLLFNSTPPCIWQSLNLTVYGLKRRHLC